MKNFSLINIFVIVDLTISPLIEKKIENNELGTFTGKEYSKNRIMSSCLDYNFNECDSSQKLTSFLSRQEGNKCGKECFLNEVRDLTHILFYRFHFIIYQNESKIPSTINTSIWE